MGSWADEMEDMPVCKFVAICPEFDIANLQSFSRYVACHLRTST